MKKLILFASILLTSTAFAIEQPIIKEETTPPPENGPITADQIPPLVTGAKPITNPATPPSSSMMPIKRADNEPEPIIGDENLSSG